MTREELMTRLMQQVRLGQSQIFHQQALVLEQASRGEPTDLALSRLDFLQFLQTMREQHLDQLHVTRAGREFEAWPMSGRAGSTVANQG